MYWFLIGLHVVVCSFLVLVVLLQAGKGGGMGIAFGGGGSQTVFGSSGAGNFLTKLTAICATIFFLNSLGLAYLSSQSDSHRLQQLAEQKAATQKVEQDAKAKVIKDIEKARDELLKKSGAATPTEGTSTSAPASSAPPASAPAAGPPPATAPASGAPPAPASPPAKTP